MIVAGFLVCAMVLGGGGSPDPVPELLVQLAFVAATLLWLWWPRSGEHLAGPAPAPLILLAALLLALPVLQLIPLPPAIWQALPMRELETASLDLVGEADSWRAWSISPPRTFAALCALIPAIGIMLAVSRLGGRDRRVLLVAIVLVALAGAALGALQMAGGPDAFRLYPKTHRGWLTAFHANRNAAADVLLIGSLALSALYASLRSRSRLPRHGLPLLCAAQAVFVVAIVLTGSRAGIALLVLTVPLHWILLRPRTESARAWWSVPAIGVGALLLVLLPLAISENARLSRVAERFDVTGDARLPLWQDVMSATHGFWPAGSGIGTFSQAFQPFETIEHLGPFFPNRAHNDYLEFVIEAGVLAPILLIIGLLILARMARRAWTMSPQDHAVQIFALGTLGIIALHSLVDYPLRNMAIACLAGVAAGLLSARSRDRREGREAGHD